MRPRILFAASFFLLVAVSFPAHGQEWRVVESGVATTLKDVMFVNKQTGWAGGDDSTLIKTTDGGATWFRQYPSVGGHVEAIWFLDEQSGYLIGGGITKGTGIYRTSDGGDTWEQYPDYGDFQDIQFVTQDTGWVIGYSYKRIWKTTDGGDTWNEKGTGLLGVFTSCSFINGMEGWVAGALSYHDNFAEEVIWHTTDGGDTWEFQEGINRTGPLTKIHVLPSGIGFAYGWGEGIRTTNKGETWEIAGPGNVVTALFALDEEHIHLHRGFADERWMYLSNDTGKSWRHVECEEIDLARGMFFIDPSFGFAVGAGGKIWRFDTTTVGVNLPAQQVPSVYVASLYPNPVWDSRAGSKTLNFEINGVNETDGIVVSVSNVLGETWIIPYSATGMDTGVHLTVSTGTLLPGYYFYRISFNKIQRTLTGQFHIIQ